MNNDGTNKTDISGLKKNIKDFFIQQLGFEFDDSYYTSKIALATKVIEEEKSNANISQKEREKRIKEQKRIIKYSQKQYDKARELMREIQSMVSDFSNKCVSGNIFRDTSGGINGDIQDSLLVIFNMLEDDKLPDIFLADEIAVKKTVQKLLQEIVNKVHLNGKRIQFEKVISYGSTNGYIGSLRETLKSGVSLYSILVETAYRKNRNFIQKNHLNSFNVIDDKNVIREFSHTLCPEMFQLQKLSEVHKMDGINTAFSRAYRAYKIYVKHALKARYAQAGLDILKGAYGFNKTVERLKQLLAKENELAKKSLQNAKSTLSSDVIERMYSDYIRFEKILDIIEQLNSKKTELLITSHNSQHEQYLNEQLSNMELEKQILLEKYPEFIKRLQTKIVVDSSDINLHEVDTEVFNKRLMVN